MNKNMKDFAKELNVDIKIVVKVVKDLGIKKTVLSDQEQDMIKKIIAKEPNMSDEKLKDKEAELKQYHNKLLDMKSDLKQKEAKFEAYKQSEENQLKERLLQEELNHEQKLKEQKIETIEKLTEEFLLNISKEYEKVKTQLDEIRQGKIELARQQDELERERNTFIQTQELFESQKEKLLNEHKEDLSKRKEIFDNQLQKERVKKLEEANKEIENLYSQKSIEIKTKEDNLTQQEIVIQTKEREMASKEKYLQSQEELLHKQAQEKVEQEIKHYKERSQRDEKFINKLNDEIFDLREKLGEKDRLEGRNLSQEIEDKDNEIRLLENKIEDIRQQKLNIENQKQKDFTAFEEQIQNLYQENQKFRIDIEGVEQLRSDNALLKEKLTNKNEHLKIIEGEKESLNAKLENIYSTGKEPEKRIEDIKQNPYLKRELKSEINISNEIDYLDMIEKNMTDYGVEYPRRLLYAFHTAIKSAEFSPLTVLSGVSGTGKSELPKLYSHFGGFNFLAEAVQPTWDSPEAMLGYYNTIEGKFDASSILKFILQTSESKNNTEFGWKESMNMILLDEMNLAHIELYFAEFLSKFELRRGKSGVSIKIKLGAGADMDYHIPLDRNLLWIGTMNEDETTKALSDKVLDRSFSINFPRPDKLLSRDKIKILDNIKDFEYLSVDTWNNWIQKTSIFSGDNRELLQRYNKLTNDINSALTQTGRAIGHRVWQSMEYYINNHPLVIANINDDEQLSKYVKQAYEEQLVQKIIPKLRGIETHGDEKKVLYKIRDILYSNDFKITDDFELSMDNPYGQFIWNSANYLKED